MSSRKRSGMPNRYEREIEEILRNLEQTDPKQGRGQKFDDRRRRKAVPPRRPRQRRTFSLHLTMSEWLLIVAVGAALVAGGYSSVTDTQTIFTGIFASFSMLCLILVMFSQFLFQPRQNRPATYKKVTAIRRGPISRFKTQWNLFMLRMRYRRRNEK